MNHLGIDLDELIDLLSRNHEALFTWDGKKYMIQPDNNKLVFYRFFPEFSAITQMSLEDDPLVGEKRVKQILSEKCLNGKSFLDLVDEIHVDEIF